MMLARRLCPNVLTFYPPIAPSQGTVAKLQELSRHFKYVVTTTVAEANGAGMAVASCGYWDAQTDGSVTVKWANTSIHCVVVVCCLAL